MEITQYKIDKGDKIFARLTMGGVTLVEFMMNTLSSVGEVIGELRKMCGDVRGLAKLYVRNQSRGWSFEKGLMVYDHEGALRSRSINYGTLPLDYDEPAPRRSSGMLFPWETH